MVLKFSDVDHASLVFIQWRLITYLNVNELDHYGPMLTRCQMDHQEHILVKFESNVGHFIISQYGKIGLKIAM